jgi:nicotinate-nucleotide pyrophosphorylase (carboxylating)
MSNPESVYKFFDRREELTIRNSSYRKFAQSLIKILAIQDMGINGEDVTSESVVSKKSAPLKATIFAGQDGTLAGSEECRWFLTDKIKIENRIKDGAVFHPHDVIMTLIGSAKDILRMERQSLNILGRMSGVATLTRKFVDAVSDRIPVAATRKTQWGFLDKRAVCIGGGISHRLGLGDGVLLKDNHLAIMKGTEVSPDIVLDKLFTSIRKSRIPEVIEIETENINQALLWAKFLTSHVQHRKINGALMLDNMLPDEIRNVVRELEKAGLRQHLLLEGSGGITLGNISSYATTGLDFVSAGALTGTASTIDFSLEVA